MTSHLRDYQFEKGQEKTPGSGRKLGVRNKLSERFLKDLHAEWERSGEATLKILAKEDPATFAKLAVGILPREYEGLPPPVTIITGVVRGDEGPSAVAVPSLPVTPSVALPQPELSPEAQPEAKLGTEIITDMKKPEFVKKAEPVKPAPIEYPETGWR